MYKRVSKISQNKKTVRCHNRSLQARSPTEVNAVTLECCEGS